MQKNISDMFGVTDKVIAITGSAGILYSYIAEVLADNGAKIALLDIDKKKVDEIAEKISKNGGKAIGVECNVLDKEKIETALDEIINAFGTCDALINGAGGNRKGACVAPNGSFMDLSIEELEKVFQLNYMGTVLPTQVFCKHFIEKKKGIIINTSSMSALAPLTNVPGYSNAKASVTNFTQWLSVQVKVDFPDVNIRINEIAPGFFDTIQNHHLLFEEDDKTLTYRGKSIIAHTPLGRFGTPDELAGPIILLLSDAGSFLHGITLCIDGGFNIYSGVGPLDEKK